MKIVIIHGQSHKGSTYHIAHCLAEKIGGEITEFFLPKDFGEFCVGCATCFLVDEKKCPHYLKLQPIARAMDQADVIILASPVYVYHATGAMKAFLDHFGYRWIVHRPEESMFSKQGVCISTAAGAGMKSTNKDMADSLFFWGIPRIYKLGKGVAAVEWEGVDEKKKDQIDKKITQIAAKIRKRSGKVRVGLQTRIFFAIMRHMQKNGFNKKDAKYWEEKGWTGNKRPWTRR
ncbi:MAG: NAD(P)H-dependent oxidoreductase [Lachnospiraceae bacterium]|nr:NAD(P)H-dependent oxidoreductase [Lachnospiraceae bacterium]